METDATHCTHCLNEKGSSNGNGASSKGLNGQATGRHKYDVTPHLGADGKIVYPKFDSVEDALMAARYEAWRMANAYGTRLVFGDAEGRTIKIDARKYSFDDIIAGKHEGDPDCYL